MQRQSFGKQSEQKKAWKVVEIFKKEIFRAEAHYDTGPHEHPLLQMKTS